ncbi:hypothetical protein MNV49_007815 [Pseudohyphozyma bogoriensis]|nr:hypothetical protein MNV49_007815 [Pseudohyphozyma bogoriensis]
MRAKARVMRQPKSPFVPRRTSGKERDLASCDLDELKEMDRRNKRLLGSPSILASLPGGDSRIKSQQARVETRIKELEDLQKIRDDLQATHLDDLPVKGDDEMEDVKPLGELMGTSPRTKRRITESFEASAPGSLTSSMSLTESMALQRLEVQRDREAAARRALEQSRPIGVGNQLKGALKNMPEMSGFMFHDDSDDDEAELDFGGDEYHEQEDLESSELNPYRTAYEQGYQRAIAQEAAESGGGGVGGY